MAAVEASIFFLLCSPPCLCSPDGSYAWLPGSSECIKCVNGLPRPASDSGTPSAGYHILEVQTVGTLDSSCPLSTTTFSYASLPLFQRCSMATPTFRLSLFVDYVSMDWPQPVASSLQLVAPHAFLAATLPYYVAHLACLQHNNHEPCLVQHLPCPGMCRTAQWKLHPSLTLPAPSLGLQPTATTN